MTAYALKGDKELCLEHGMNDYIAKRVNRKRLIAVLSKWLLRIPDYRKKFEEQLIEMKRREEAVALAQADKQEPEAGAVPNGVGLAPVEPHSPAPQKQTETEEQKLIPAVDAGVVTHRAAEDEVHKSAPPDTNPEDVPVEQIKDEPAAAASSSKGALPKKLRSLP